MSERRSGPHSNADPARARLTLKRQLSRRPSRIFRIRVAEPARRTRWPDVALIICFLLGISLPLVGLLRSLDANFALEENRTLASRPELNWNARQLAQFPASFEAFFNDHFGFRKRLIYWLNVAKVAAFHVSPSPKVVLGQNGWLFYGDADIPYFRAVKPLTPAQLLRWQKRLEERQAWLADRGIPYLLVFAPLKSTVYPQFMPHAYNRIGTESRLDQLVAHMAAHSNVPILDLRGAILAEKSRHQVFYRTDTHWNNRGAYVGYRQIMTALSRWFPELEAIPVSAFEESDYSEPGRDLALILGMRSYFLDHYVDLRMIATKRAHEVQPGPAAGKLWTRGPDMLYEQQEARLPRAVMFRDSFATWLIPLLSENFSHVLYSWQYTFDHEIVLRERPDVVIQEMVERALVDDSPPS